MTREEIQRLLAVATPAERNLVALYLDPHTDWAPLSGPQMDAYLSDADELYYGGAAGGGKSDLLLGLAATAHRKSLILRRQSTQLRELTERARLLLASRGTYSSQIGLYRLNDGRLIEFSACNLLSDREKWRGRAHDLKCVGRGTPVRLADGSYRPIEAVRVGDLVATLDGPRRVTRALAMGTKDCVEVTATLAGQTFRQVQSWSHALLTTNGWASPDRWLAASEDAHDSSPRRAPVAGKSPRSCIGQRETERPGRVGGRSDRAPLGELLRPAPHVARPGRSGLPADTGSIGPNSDSVESAGGPREVALRALCLPSRPTPASSPRVRGPGATLATAGRPSDPISGDVPVLALLEGSRVDCLSDNRLDGGRLPRFGEGGRACPLPPGDAAVPNPRGSVSDDLAETPTHSRCIQRYVHPYTGDIRQTPAGTRTCALTVTPVGRREVFDLTVESANHYMTGTLGLVNRNCFDELPTFHEEQYIFIRGWCRTTTVGQRCRTVSTGNPPSNAEGEWVVRRWAPWLDPQHPHPARPGELRWFAVVGKDTIEVDGPTPFFHREKLVKPSSRTFIPARLTDNPFLMATDYETVIMSMPEPLRSQMLYGDHTAGRDDDPWQVIPTAWVRAAQARWTPDGRPRDAKAKPIPLDTVGVDVARGGRDQTVLSRRYGRWFAPLERHPGTSTPDGPAVARLAAAALAEGGVANVDVIGVGASVYDHLRSLGQRAVGVNFSEATEWRDKSNRLGMVNVRALAYWSLREALDPASGQDLALPPDTELLSDLCSPRWLLTARGVQIETKDEIKKRIGRSTDAGDAVALAHLTQYGLPFQHPSWAEPDDEDDD